MTFPPRAIAIPRIVPLAYDPQPVVTAMAHAGLPVEFQQSRLTGIWITCAEILPLAERQVRSRLPGRQLSPNRAS